MDNKILEAFGRIVNLLDEYEDFMSEMPFCPEFETELENDDFKVVSEALNKFIKYEEALSKKRLTEQFELDILTDGDDPELYDDMEHLYSCYAKLGELENIHEEGKNNE